MLERTALPEIQDSSGSLEQLRSELELLSQSAGIVQAEDSSSSGGLPFDRELLTGCALDTCLTALQQFRDRSTTERREIDPTLLHVMAVVAAAALTHRSRFGVRRESTMEDLSELAHRMNNPLTTILGRAQILRARPGQDANVVKAAGVIEDSAQSLAGLVRELATIARETRTPEQLTGV